VDLSCSPHQDFQHPRQHLFALFNPLSEPKQALPDCLALARVHIHEKRFHVLTWLESPFHACAKILVKNGGKLAQLETGGVMIAAVPRGVYRFDCSHGSQYFQAFACRAQTDAQPIHYDIH
jgi:hypothetical protein